MRTIAKVRAGYGPFFERIARQFRGTPWQRMDKMWEVLFKSAAEDGATLEIDLAIFYGSPLWMQWHRDMLARARRDK